MGTHYKILLIGRSKRFSPNSVERDAAILNNVAERLRHDGHEIVMMSEDMLAREDDEMHNLPGEADFVFSMGRGVETLTWLAQLEEAGVRVYNSARAMLAINRRRLLTEASRQGIATAPFAIGPLERQPLPYPVWWKRDDRVSQERGDVQLVCNDAEWQAIAERGIQEYVVEGHLEGDLVKFYGVHGTDFFHWNYPEFSKFGNETMNGKARGTAFDAYTLRKGADALASSVGLSIYGGDAIVTADGVPHIIDLNDWPSFSSCREEAARAIALRVKN